MFCEENYITEDDSKLKNNPSNIIDATYLKLLKNF